MLGYKSTQKITRQGRAMQATLSYSLSSSNNIEMISVSEKYRMGTLVTTDTSNSDIRSMPGPMVGSKLIRAYFSYTIIFVVPGGGLEPRTYAFQHKAISPASQGTSMCTLLSPGKVS